MARILFAYSTVDGHTLEICERLKAIVEASGHSTSLVGLDDGGEPDLGGFDGVVVGASIRYGKHRPQVTAFIDRHAAYLEATPSAFFSVNAVARKPDKRTPETNPYVRKFLQGIAWQPQTIEIFGGKIDYPRYSTFDRSMIRFIMWMTKGPTDPTAVVDFTDWERVDAFGERIVDGFGQP